MGFRKTVAVAIAAIAFISPSFADDVLDFGFEGVRFFDSVIPGGLDLSLTYLGLGLSDAADTKLFLKAGGGYENASLVRDPLTGDPSAAIAGNEYYSPNFQWELAFIQGFSRRDDGDNLLEAFAFYRGRYDIYLNELSESVFSDARGMFGTSVMAGVSYDSRVLSRHRSKEGVYAEATAEWGPGFINEKTDFWRVSGQLRGFLPVYDLPSDGGNLFNVYLAGFLGADYAAGTSVPIYVNESFGGRSLRDSIGNCVRGYGWNKYDTSFKSAATAEVRLVGPAIVLDPIVPYLFGFVDAGYYAGFADSANYSEASGFLASAGGGVALDLVGFAQASFIVGLRLVDDAAVPYAYDADSFFTGVKFFLHF
ncbi:MAG: BamA/TamA family outer membrane protein [Spirochaetes bacterium]|nr:BamA/TamA family outer membrane protein [Spirochaetota bacterium]MBU1082041.1 BamA/TamA family outer membrane protein [Spirochaetota bacterium]